MYMKWMEPVYNELQIMQARKLRYIIFFQI